MQSRRNFLKSSSLVSLAPFLPAALGKTAFSEMAHAAEAGTDQKVLVVIQMNGGNDGINTVVPYGDDAYGRARKKLRLKTKDLHKLNDHVGLHRSMKSAKELFDDGRLSIIQGVGYPNPDRSHFASMKTWQTARLDKADHTGNGWLGLALDAKLAASAKAHQTACSDAIYVGDEATPSALWGRRSSTIGLAKASDLRLDLPAWMTAPSTPSKELDHDSLQHFMRRQIVSAQTAAEEFARQAAGSPTDVTYSNSGLGNRLKLISQLLRSGNAARVYYTVQSGYDTHADQRNTHARLLRDFSRSTKSFLDDLKAAGLDDRVVVMAFSEFGRRVAENDSAGTDHGTAGPVFLAGSPVRGGLVGETPDLSDLVDGDLKCSLDFRRVYASLLRDWLDVPPATICGGEFKPLDLFTV